MNKAIKKALVVLLTLSLGVSSAVALSSCSLFDSLTGASASVSSAAPTISLPTDSGGTTQEPPKPLPSVAPKEVSIGKDKISATEYDLYYYLNYQQLQQYVAYGSVGPTLAAGGLDLEAACTMTGYESLTWGEYIHDITRAMLQKTYILLALGKEQSITALTEDSKLQVASLFANMEQYAAQAGGTLDQFLASTYGETATVDTLTPVIERYFLANNDIYYALMDSFTFSDEELKAFYETNKANYKNEELPVVRHMLFLAPKGAANQEDASEEDMAKAKAKAEEVLGQIASAEDMVRIGDELMADGTVTESAEYVVNKDQMVKEFEDWCFDPARKPGDKGIVQTMYGFHIMYFIGTQPDWMEDAKTSLAEDRLNGMIDAKRASKQFDITIDGEVFVPIIPAPEDKPAETVSESTAAETAATSSAA